MRINKTVAHAKLRHDCLLIIPEHIMEKVNVIVIFPHKCKIYKILSNVKHDKLY